MEQPNNNQQQPPGESAITPQVAAQTAPDVVNPQGLQQLHQQMSATIAQKGMLDFIFKGIAQKTGAQFSSRIKNAQSVVQKIAQKRMQGRDYNLDDVNDAYGARFITADKDVQDEIKKLVSKAESLGVIQITKKQDVTTGTYHAYHIDFQTKDGANGEIQIMKP